MKTDKVAAPKCQICGYAEVNFRHWQDMPNHIRHDFKPEVGHTEAAPAEPRKGFHHAYCTKPNCSGCACANIRERQSRELAELRQASPTALEETSVAKTSSEASAVDSSAAGTPQS